MYKQDLGSYREVVVYDKSDGDMSVRSHPIYSTYFSTIQRHTATIYQISKNTPVGKQQIIADALVADRDAPMGVYVADCVPLILVNDCYVAAVHCSWKTLYTGIIHRVYDWFVDQGGGPTQGYIGPCIKTYEVGKEFATYFPAPFLSLKGERYLFDLVGYTTSQLSYRGFDTNSLIIDPGCTRDHNDQYRSYRKGNANQRNFVAVQRK